MAKLNLKIHSAQTYSLEASDSYKTESKDIILSTEVTNNVPKTTEVYLKEKDDKVWKYTFLLSDLRFRKKMYQPTEIEAHIIVNSAIYVEEDKGNGSKDKKTNWKPIMQSELISAFKDKQVSLYDTQDVTGDTLPAEKFVGDDFFVHDIKVLYHKDCMRIVLKIYSLDKLMTLKFGCRSFISKKLGAAILKNELLDYKVPYKKDDTCIKFNEESLTEDMKVLSYGEKSSSENDQEAKVIKNEHIFPYLVQYNESFYDMLARTTNRWGEFLYYEDNRLNIGYKKSEPVKLDDKFTDFAYIDYEDKYMNLVNSGSLRYDFEGCVEEGLVKSTVIKDPNKVEGILFGPGSKWDQVVMKQLANIFKTIKSIPVYLGDLAYTEATNKLAKTQFVNNENEKIEKKYFTDELKKATPEKFGQDGDNEACNLFSELKSKYTTEKYSDVFLHEVVAGRNAVRVNFDTTYPCLKLGQIVELYSKQYIVVQIDCKSATRVEGGNATYTFEIVGLPLQAADGQKESQFYPTILPTGHIRFAEPQLATVTDSNDPREAGRVRVMFSWQDIPKKDEKTLDYEKAVPNSTPWIMYASNAGGKKGLAGKHYVGDKVFVDFIDGNIECPYVMGALSQGAKTDIECTTPGGHTLTLNDKEGGLTTFLKSTFMPIAGTAQGLFPGVGWLNKEYLKDVKNSACFAGGFELTDNYGIYKISGSTDNRAINISSPWGIVKLDAFTGIMISAPNGDVSITGKNVKISAGNNLTLESGVNVRNKLKPKKYAAKASVGAFFSDVAAQATRRVFENISGTLNPDEPDKTFGTIDLGLVRSVVEVVMRPSEGRLDLKSNRYLSLAAAGGDCKYPTAAYKSVDDMRKKADKEQKEDIMHTVNSGLNSLFKGLSSITDDIAENYKKNYNKGIALKQQFNEALRDLKALANDPNQAVSKSFKDLKNDFYQVGKYEKWEAEKLGFLDNVKDDNEEAVAEQCVINILGVATSQRDMSRKRQTIMARRRAAKATVVDKANELRKLICNLNAFQPTKVLIQSHLYNGLHDSMPKGYIDKVLYALSKENCQDSAFYNITSDKTTFNGLLTYKNFVEEKKYLRRKAAISLLEAYGFSDETRREIAINNVNQKPAKPTTREQIIDDDTWANYVNSLNGVPAVKRNSSFTGAIVDIAKDTLKTSLDRMKFWKGIQENLVWAEGQNGEILMSFGDKTYHFNAQDGVTINTIEGVEPSYTTLSDSSAALGDKEKQKIAAYVNRLRNTLRGI